MVQFKSAIMYMESDCGNRDGISGSVNADKVTKITAECR
jgi:hypothetical protein